MSDGQYSGSERGLGGDQGGLPVAGQPGAGVAGDAGSAYAADGGANAGASGGAVPSGHDGIGLHLAAGDCGARSAEL